MQLYPMYLLIVIVITIDFAIGHSIAYYGLNFISIKE